MTIIHMAEKHNHNRLAFLEVNKRDYFKHKDAERFEIEIEGRNDKNLQNEQNPEKDPEPDNSDIIFVPELLSALQEAIKVTRSIYLFIFSCTTSCLIVYLYALLDFFCSVTYHRVVLHPDHINTTCHRINLL